MTTHFDWLRLTLALPLLLVAACCAPPPVCPQAPTPSCDGFAVLEPGTVVPAANSTSTAAHVILVPLNVTAPPEEGGRPEYGVVYIGSPNQRNVAITTPMNTVSYDITLASGSPMPSASALAAAVTQCSKKKPDPPIVVKGYH